MKKQKRNVKQNKRKNKYILPVSVMSAVAVIAVAVMLTVIFTQKPSEPASFVPPPFDSTAQSGAPDVPDGLGYSRMYKDGMDFSAWICGRVVLEGNKADVYFTNPEDNGVWLRLRVLDKSGNVLGETGIIKPGEYIQSVEFSVIPAVGTEIELKIMAYEPETYHSAGAVPLNTVISGK